MSDKLFETFVLTIFVLIYKILRPFMWFIPRR